MADEMTKAQMALAKVQKKAATVQRLLATQDGKDLLEFLKQEFFYEVRRESPHGAAFRLGQCDVIAYIEQLNQHGRMT